MTCPRCLHFFHPSGIRQGTQSLWRWSWQEGCTALVGNNHNKTFSIYQWQGNGIGDRHKMFDGPSSLPGLNTMNGSQRMVLEAFILPLTERNSTNIGKNPWASHCKRWAKEKVNVSETVGSDALIWMNPEGVMKVDGSLWDMHVKSRKQQALVYRAFVTRPGELLRMLLSTRGTPLLSSGGGELPAVYLPDYPGKMHFVHELKCFATAVLCCRQQYFQRNCSEWHFSLQLLFLQLILDKELKQRIKKHSSYLLKS